ncbi:MAG: carboxypeptidase regulatory-like domain-containing protein [Candidatus Cloacimonadaceae bacterium]|jgi:hypothetical protein
MKRLTTLTLLLVLVLSLGAATVTVVRPFREQTDFPVSTRCHSSYSQVIYPQTKINHEGEISKLRFFHKGSANGSLNNSQFWKIYLGHIQDAAFASTSDWEPIANLTEVFSGNVPVTLPPGNREWIEFILDTPFVYNNTDNLVVAVFAANYDRVGSVSWGHDNSDSYSALMCRDYYSVDIDINNPPDAEYVTRLFPALQLVFPDTEVPVAPELRSPADQETVVNGQSLDWILPHTNNYYSPTLEPDASGYDVYIDGVLVSENQPGTRYVLNGLEAGVHNWYVVARNNIGVSPPSTTGAFTVVPGVALGDKSEDLGLPMDPSHKHSYSQSIILQSEIDVANQRIEKMAYYWNGQASYIHGYDWMIYMGHTDKTEFSDGQDWVPVSEMTLVFDGHMNFPGVTGWFEIELDYPFLYNNTDNLVVAVYEKNQYGGCESSYFYSTATPGQCRSLVHNRDESIDPNTPPNGYPTDGIPNIMLRFGEIPSSAIVRMLPLVLDYRVTINGEPATQNVTITNMGGVTMDISAANLSIIGPNADEFSFDLVNLPMSLGASQHVDVPITLAGITPGPISAALRLDYNGEIHEVELLANVTLPGVVTIGDGIWSQLVPFIIAEGRHSSASLYTSDQISGVGLIDMLAWDCTEVGNSEAEYKIYLQNTMDDTIENVILPPSPGQLQLVKQGRYTPGALGWQMFELDGPFYYTGGNLVVVVETSRRLTSGTNMPQFSCTNCGYPRQKTWWYNPPENPGFYDIFTQVPNIMMHFAWGGAEDRLCALKLSGPHLAVVGETSHYTMRIRNGGTNAQANYQLKLMGPDDTELAVVNGPLIESGAFAEVVIPWTPTAEGQIEIYGKVELNGINLNFPCTNTLEVEVLPAGMHLVNIGAGDKLDSVPIDFSYYTYVCQSLYRAEELDLASGTINAMTLYNDFEYSMTRPTKIFLTSTFQNNLSAGFIPTSEMTLVYDGTVAYPRGESYVHINFQTPYVYTGGNLVMMFYRPWDTTSSMYVGRLQFRCQDLGDGRSRIAGSKRNIDLLNPPTTTLTGIFPQVSFLCNEDAYEHELAALSISGESSAVLGSNSSHTFRIKNYGSADQSNYTVKLMGPDEVQLASVAGPPIRSKQSLEIELPWTPDTLGEISIYGKVELAGDEFAGNNRTPDFQITVYPAGAAEVRVAVNDGNDAVIITWPGSRQLTGYQVYRLQAGQEQNEALWTELVPEPGDAFGVTDTAWLTLPDGDYRWAVKTVYTDGSASLPCFSGILTNNVRTGKIVGKVMSKIGTPIAGVSIVSGRLMATTNSEGEYSLMVPVSNRSVRVFAKGFEGAVVENVIVGAGLFTKLDFTLIEASGEPQVPVVATALNGNYPNPFNPETTISYSVKEPGKVKLQIYNIRGQLVRTLINEAHDTGHYKRVFDGKDNDGRNLASGAYLIRMSAPGYQKASKMMLIK